jgi:hypothetical protein
VSLVEPSEQADVLLDQGLVDRPVLRVELVEQFHEKPVAPPALEIRAGGNLPG